MKENLAKQTPNTIDESLRATLERGTGNYLKLKREAESAAMREIENGGVCEVVKSHLRLTDPRTSTKESRHFVLLPPAPLFWVEAADGMALTKDSEALAILMSCTMWIPPIVSSPAMSPLSRVRTLGSCIPSIPE